MAKITQEQLIKQLKILKEIKPRKEWAYSLKFEILNSKLETNPKFFNFEFRISNFFFGLKPQKSLVYAFAVVLFLIVGVFGFAVNTVPGDLLFPIKKIAEQSQAALTGQTGLKNDVAVLSSRINDLAQVAKEGRTDNISSAINEINSNASELARSLKNNPTKDLATLKDIATSLKTLADVPGTDLSQNSDVKDLYQAVVQGQIADLQETTLTDDQNNILTQAEDLYNRGKYTDALEKILLINN